MASRAVAAAAGVSRWGAAAPSPAAEMLVTRSHRWQPAHLPMMIPSVPNRRGFPLSSVNTPCHMRPLSRRAVAAFNEDWSLGAFSGVPGTDDVEASLTRAQRSVVPGPINSEPASSEFVRDWNGDGEPSATRQQKQNRRRRMQARRTKNMMEKTSEARALTRRISVLRSQRRSTAIVEAIRDLRSGEDKGLLNTINYNAALSALVALNSIDEAKQVFAWLTEDMGIDSVSVSSMIKGYGRANELDEAFHLLERYEEIIQNIAPRRLYVMLLNACAEAGDTRRARAMMHRIGYERLTGPYSLSTFPYIFPLVLFSFQSHLLSVPRTACVHGMQVSLHMWVAVNSLPRAESKRNS